MDPPYLVVGHLQRPHGTKGEILVRSLTDHPESTFRAGVELRVSDPDGEVPDELFPPLQVAAARSHAGGFLVQFEGIDDRDRAEFIRGRFLLRPFEEAEPLEPDEVFHYELRGLTVTTLEGIDVGRIREVYDVEPVELLSVTTEHGEILIPFTREIVVEWRLEEGRLVVDPPEGLLDL